MEQMRRQLPLPSLLSLLALACAGTPPSAEKVTREVDAGAPERGIAATSAPAPRDWTVSPAVVELDTPGDVFAVGDPHGDHDRLVRLLVAGGLLAAVPAPPDAAIWSGGQAVLVCTGDAIDKWGQGLEVLTLLQGLEGAAARQGGRVVFTLGNHEAEFLSGKSSDFTQQLAARGLDPSEVAAGRHPLGVWLRGRPFAARINDWFFAHAGDTGRRTLPELKSELRAQLDATGFASPILLGPEGLLSARLSPAPWWESAAGPSRGLADFLTPLGVKHLGFGHQPGRVIFADGVERRAGTLFERAGQAVLLDTGMSRGVNDSEGMLLRIRGATLTGIGPDGVDVPLAK